MIPKRIMLAIAVLSLSGQAMAAHKHHHHAKKHSQPDPIQTVAGQAVYCEAFVWRDGNKLINHMQSDAAKSQECINSSLKLMTRSGEKETIKFGANSGKLRTIYCKRIGKKFSCNIS